MVLVMVVLVLVMDTPGSSPFLGSGNSF